MRCRVLVRLCTGEPPVEVIAGGFFLGNEKPPGRNPRGLGRLSRRSVWNLDNQIFALAEGFFAKSSHGVVDDPPPEIWNLRGDHAR